MSRTVVAIGLALLAALVVALLMWWLGFYLFPPSPVLDQNPALVRADPGRLPAAPLVWQILGQALGAFLGGLLAMRWGEAEPRSAWAVGGGLAVILTLALAIWFPRPIWFVVANLVVTGAAAWGAGYLGAPRPGRARATA